LSNLVLGDVEGEVIERRAARILRRVGGEREACLAGLDAELILTIRSNQQVEGLAVERLHCRQRRTRQELERQQTGTPRFWLGRDRALRRHGRQIVSGKEGGSRSG
jgi:hypothetical protein